MKDNQIPAGTYLGRVLAAFGTTHVFYMAAMLRRSLQEMEALGIKTVLTHSEKAAAYMADGYGRIKGSPGICVAQSVGAANLAAGLQDAMLACSPVMAITGMRPPEEQLRNAYQEIAHRPLFDPVTKFHGEAYKAEQLPFLLRQGFREAVSGKPGPVHIDLMGYSGRLTEAEQIEDIIETAGTFTRVPACRPEPGQEEIRRAVEYISRASKPVIVAGGGTALSDAGAELEALAEKLQVPVAVSLNGKGSLRDDHPLNIGLMGKYSRGNTNAIVKQADLVIFIGSNTGDLLTLGWTVPPQDVSTIQINIEPCELGRNYRNVVPLQGDAKKVITRLLSSLSGNFRYEDWTDKSMRQFEEGRDDRSSWRDSSSIPIRPERLCSELSKALPSDGIVVSDTGHAGIWTGNYLSIVKPGQRYIRAAGSMGWAFPAAIGAKCAAPDRPVFCFIGDGGFWYHISELETAARYGIGVVLIVNNNRSFSQCTPEIQFIDVDFAKVADEMGCEGVRVESPDEIEPALKSALESPRTTVLNVITDASAFPR